MKRVLAVASALALAVGAFAPAAFASDLPAVPTNTDNLSIWDTSSPATPENPYNTSDLFDYCMDFWGDLFDDGRFNNATVNDFQRDIVGYAVSNFCSTHPDEVQDGVTTSYFDDIVDYICDHPSDFDIYWLPDAVASVFSGSPYQNLQFGVDFSENLKDYIYDNYYHAPSGGGPCTIGGYQFYAGPLFFYRDSTFYSAVGYNGAATLLNSSAQAFSYATVYTTNVNGSYPLFVVSSSGASYFNVPNYRISNNRESGSTWDTARWYSGTTSGYYTTNGRQPYGNWGFDVQFTSIGDACAAFFGGDPIISDQEPISDGKVYFRETPLNPSVNFSFPAFPVSNSKAVSNYYYTTYGDEWEDSTTIIDNTVYNNNTTTVYPITYENNIPIWLVTPSIDVTTYDYSLELPSADLEELPSEFEGGGDFFQDSFLALGGFGSFVLIALSFGLVALFFKG